MKGMSDLFVYDEWLSVVINKPAYALSSLDHEGPIDVPKGNLFIYTKIPTEAVSKLVLLQQMGFYVVETNIQFQLLNPRLGKGPIEARFAEPGDCTAVKALAHQAFYHDRFHRDPNISNKVASNLKQEWAGNFFSGNRGKWMIVVEGADGIRGFLQLLYEKPQGLTIDLIAVEDASKRQGVGRAMLAFALDSCEFIPRTLKAGTQIANTESVRMYLNLGFQIISSSYVLHYHRMDGINENWEI